MPAGVDREVVVDGLVAAEAVRWCRPVEMGPDTAVCAHQPNSDEEVKVTDKHSTYMMV